MYIDSIHYTMSHRCFLLLCCGVFRLSPLSLGNGSEYKLTLSVKENIQQHIASLSVFFYRGVHRSSLYSARADNAIFRNVTFRHFLFSRYQIILKVLPLPAASTSSEVRSSASLHVHFSKKLKKTYTCLLSVYTPYRQDKLQQG